MCVCVSVFVYYSNKKKSIKFSKYYRKTSLTSKFNGKKNVDSNTNRPADKE